jgi:hypothetical protein
MNIIELHEFIRQSRSDEGVSWYLVDSSPLTRRGILYTLYVFKDGELVSEIKNIEERERRQVPASILRNVADARKLAGCTPAFTRAAGANWRSLFRGHRRRWIDGGYRTFVIENNCAG